MVVILKYSERDLKKGRVPSYIVFEMENVPNIHRSGSIRGMYNFGWRSSDKIVRIGNYYYNFRDDPNI